MSKVTVVGAGMTTVKVEYDGQTFSFIVRGWGSSTGTGSGNVTEDGAEPSYFLRNTVGGSASDVSINVGYRFQMELLNSDNQVITNATWTCETEGICTVDNGLVTGVADGITKVYVSCDGLAEPLIFTVRVYS